MKNKILIGSAIILGFLILFSNCKKDDDDSSTNLEGTAWFSDDKSSNFFFLSTVKGQFYLDDNYDFIFTVEGDNISFDFGNEKVMTGKITGNTITAIYGGETFTAQKLSISSKAPTPESLIGTKWKLNDNKSIEFTSETAGELYYLWRETPVTEDFSYTLTKNIITLTPDELDPYSSYAVFNGNSLIFLSGTVYTKQE